MHHFFLPLENIRDQQGEVIFPPETARQILKVLRLRNGQNVLVLDNQGHQYTVILQSPDEKGLSGTILTNQAAEGEPDLRITLFLGLTQREKFEWMLQKCTESGASAFVPMVTTRSLVQDVNETQKKHNRWKSILQEAAEQSGRGLIPQLFPAMSFENALEFASAAGKGAPNAAFIFYENEQDDLKQALKSLPEHTQHMALMIGPEGGFTPEEVNAAEKAGFKSVSLGKRVLRMETAALVATALVLYELES